MHRPRELPRETRERARTPGTVPSVRGHTEESVTVMFFETTQKPRPMASRRRLEIKVFDGFFGFRPEGGGESPESPESNKSARQIKRISAANHTNQRGIGDLRATNHPKLRGGDLHF